MIRFFIKIYILVLIADAILSYLPQFHHQPWAKQIRKLANYSLDPIRKALPRDLPFDFSPVVVIVLLNLLMLLW